MDVVRVHRVVYVYEHGQVFSSSGCTCLGDRLIHLAGLDNPKSSHMLGDKSKTREKQDDGRM